MDTRLHGSYRSGDTNLFRPKIEVGQWWAQREPATLMQVQWISNDGSFGQVSFRQWPSNIPAEPPTEMLWVLPTDQKLEYLYFEKWVNLPHYYIEKDWNFGEIRIASAEERVFFVAGKRRLPSEDPRCSAEVLIRASWEVLDSQVLNSNIYAPGSILGPTSRTVYDLLMAPDEEVTHARIFEKTHQSLEVPARKSEK